MKILENQPLKSYTSFKTGGIADLLLMPQSIDELCDALRQYPNAYVFGNLSNTLITDKGIRGTIILTTGLNNITVNGREVTAYCGASLSALAYTAMQNSLAGCEFLYGIPGTVGGGIYMNAGAYGGEICDRLVSVTVYDGTIHTIAKSQLDFSYRHSSFMTNNKIILSATFMLEDGNAQEIRQKMDDLMSSRRSKQPLEYPSCGSTFKRPLGSFAGRLIEDCGLKGRAIGGAEVSTKHAGFIVNKGDATSGDIISLIQLVKDEVYKKTQIMLEEEVKIVGEL